MNIVSSYFFYHHQNFDSETSIALVVESLDNDFFDAELLTEANRYIYRELPNGKQKLEEHTLDKTIEVTLSHDHQKKRFIQTASNIYLRELGLTNASGELRREMNDKYKQINRYIELLSPYLNELKSLESISIADMGSGKGYLTFALYDYLTVQLQLQASVTGVEYRQDMVELCNAIAQKCDYNSLNFKQGTIQNAELDKMNVLIALHACNTATDDAIYRGISAGAELIVCAPCCHKQVRTDMNTVNVLSNITRFGILKERQAEILTDTIRALILEAHGYKTNVFEFISSEHTPKNLMIVGRKSTIKQKERDDIINQIIELRQLYGIRQHYLECLCGLSTCK